MKSVDRDNYLFSILGVSGVMLTFSFFILYPISPMMVEGLIYLALMGETLAILGFGIYIQRNLNVLSGWYLLVVAIIGFLIMLSYLYFGNYFYLELFRAGIFDLRYGLVLILGSFLSVMSLGAYLFREIQRSSENYISSYNTNSQDTFSENDS